MREASEVKRWWVRDKNYDASPVKRDMDRLCCDYEPEPQKLEAFVEVIEAEPVLARIKQLEAQLKEANEVAEFYGKSRLYVNVGCEAELLDDRGSKARAWLVFLS